MGEREGSEARYRAFLSYSHKDAAAAGRLHRRLEAYRIPRRLVGRETARGPVPARLWPIFRDREELPAATDLSETVREALAQSGALIILCSPAAAGSLWVAEEIRVFRELHPDRPILAAVLEGDPPDCFPDVLRAQGDGHEPLATDLRPERDGERLGLLKLVAGITGLGLDDLVQRDASRRVRRVMAVTAGAVAAMLVMAVLVVVAWSARAEAEHQRIEAEGLVEFMQTNLRERLRSVGRLDIMREVNRRALAHFEGRRAAGDTSFQATIGRARTLQAIGEDDLTRGDYSAALGRFREAHQTTSAQLATLPNDADSIFAHAQSEYWLGRVAALRGDFRSALGYYRRYHQLASRLDGLAPNEPRSIGELAYSESNLGNVNLNGLNQPEVARAHFSRSLSWFKRLADLQPRNLLWTAEAADAHAWISDTWFVVGNYDRARSERLEEQRLKRNLLRLEPMNRDYQYGAIIASRSLARIDFEIGLLPRALSELDRVRPTMQTLLSEDPANLVWRHQAVRIDIDRSRIFERLGNGPARRDALRQAQSILSFEGQIPAVLSEENRRLREWLAVQLNQHVNRGEAR